MINVSDSLTQVLEQVGFLDRYLQESMKPALVFREAISKSEIQWFDGRIGETKTFTRASEIPPNTTPLNPSTNTGLDNGISPPARSFEQWQAQLYEWASGQNVDLPTDETLLASVYLDDVKKLAGQAANTLESVAVSRAFGAYDSGDTFALAAVSDGTTIHVDDVTGFTTQFQSSLAPSYGLPQPVSLSNKLAILVIAADGSVAGAANVESVAIDGSNVSYKQSGPLVLGQSGVLTLDAAITCAAGARVVAMDPNNPSTSVFNPTYKDGSYVIRPLTSGGAMIGSAYAMASDNILVPSVSVPYARSLLARRRVPKLRNGLYGCAIDSTLLAQFYQDDGFLKATATRWDQSPVFKDGIIAAGWGIEFTEATQVPVYNAPAGGFPLRHAFVFGEDVLSEHPFVKAKAAQTRAASAGDMFDFRWVDRIEFITQAPLDRLAENMKLSYKYLGDFQPGTDKGSNPLTIYTSDWCRFKRGVMIQAASAI